MQIKPKKTWKAGGGTWSIEISFHNTTKNTLGSN